MKPMFFNTEMVKAILDGRKTVTRRVVKQSIVDKFVLAEDGRLLGSFDACHPEWGGYPTVDDAPYHPGDILYVRETWMRETEQGIPTGGYIYRASDNPAPDGNGPLRWRPSIHMPKEAARLFLRVTDVRVERLQDITEAGAFAEGVKDPYNYQNPEWYDQRNLTTSYSRDAFAGLWDSTIKKADLSLYGWDANPWVWVIEFERISKEEAHGQA